MLARALDGFVVAVTADRRSDEQIELLIRHGACALHGPTIQTLPIVADGQLRVATESLLHHPPAIVIANTGIGMRSWLSAAESWGLGERLAAASTPSPDRGTWTQGCGLPRHDRLRSAVAGSFGQIVRGHRPCSGTLPDGCARRRASVTDPGPTTLVHAFARWPAPTWWKWRHIGGFVPTTRPPPSGCSKRAARATSMP